MMSAKLVIFWVDFSQTLWSSRLVWRQTFHSSYQVSSTSSVFLSCCCWLTGKCAWSQLLFWSQPRLWCLYTAVWLDSPRKSIRTRKLRHQVWLMKTWPTSRQSKPSVLKSLLPTSSINSSRRRIRLERRWLTIMVPWWCATSGSSTVATLSFVTSLASMSKMVNSQLVTCIPSSCTFWWSCSVSWALSTTSPKFSRCREPSTRLEFFSFHPVSKKGTTIRNLWLRSRDLPRRAPCRSNL